MLDLFQSSQGLTLLLGMTGLGLVGLAGLAFAPSGREDPLQKFEKASKQTLSAGPDDKTLRRGRGGKEIAAITKYAKFLEPTDEKELTEARQTMIQAGYHGKDAVRHLHALQFLLAVGAMLVSVLVVFVLMPERFEGSVVATAATLVSPMLMGYFAPKRWVQKRADARKEEIIAGFPDALDMMLICVEAGQSLDQSINRVAKEIAPAYPALAEELTTVGEQVKAGRERGEVLREMAKRLDVPDITSFVTVIVQAATYGTSITDALRVFSSEMRDKRVMRAEEKANILPTKMTLGTMMFTVPPLLIILIGPSVVGVMTELSAEAIMGQ
ncbi:MAG: type II secretion system F family protein [Roseinatronobacter sp.]